EPACHRHPPPCFASQPCSVPCPRPRASPGPRRESFTAGRREPRAPSPPPVAPWRGSPGARPGDGPPRPCVRPSLCLSGRCRSRPDPASDRLSIHHYERPVRGPVGVGTSPRGGVLRAGGGHFHRTDEKGNPNGPPRPIIESLTAGL